MHDLYFTSRFLVLQANLLWEWTAPGNCFYNSYISAIWHPHYSGKYISLSSLYLIHIPQVHYVHPFFKWNFTLLEKWIHVLIDLLVLLWKKHDKISQNRIVDLCHLHNDRICLLKMIASDGCTLYHSYLKLFAETIFQGICVALTCISNACFKWRQHMISDVLFLESEMWYEKRWCNSCEVLRNCKEKLLYKVLGLYFLHF